MERYEVLTHTHIFMCVCVCAKFGYRYVYADELFNKDKTNWTPRKETECIWFPCFLKYTQQLSWDVFIQFVDYCSWLRSL